MDAWSLIKDGRYADAVAALTAELRLRESALAYNNRGTAHLNLGQFDRALFDFTAADRCRPSNVARSSSVGEKIGTVHWLAGDEHAALKSWAETVAGLQSGDIGYSDAAGGVGAASLLWFAAVSTANRSEKSAAERFFRTNHGSKHGTGWPGPVADFLLNRITDEQLLSRVSNTPVRRERELCQAYFYIAVLAREDGDRVAWQANMRSAADLTAAKIETEFYLANHELKRPR